MCICVHVLLSISPCVRALSFEVHQVSETQHQQKLQALKLEVGRC
jgi:hypothetical protein